MNKKLSTVITIIIFLLIAVLIPIPKASVNLWLYFTDEAIEVLEEDGFMAYYETFESPALSDERMVQGVYDADNRRVGFKFDSSYVEDIKSLRIDFPAIEQLVTVAQVAVSSGGTVKKQIDPAKFLNEANIVLTNDLNGYNALESKCKTVFATGNDDPYIILSDDATAYIIKQQSKHIATRVCLLLLMMCSYICYKKIKF